MRKYKLHDTDSKVGMLVREGKSVYNLKERAFLFAKRMLEITELLPSSTT
jgi:hypothetical protein